MSRRAVCAAVLVALVTGCSAEAEDGDAKGAVKSDAEVAESGRTIGGKSSACELPVTFDIAEDWKAEAVDTSDPDFVMRQGPVTLVCEIDAKPAGNIGFLRAWTGKPGDTDARGVLESFVAGQDGVSKEKYGSFTANGLDGAEVTYTYTSELLDEAKQERALAVTTNEGPVVLHLGGLDSGEHRAMLPALELARKTLHTSRAE
ncbi:lipoprotein [Streptomyces sp. GXMU-J15]|uniref:Lipoprotein n=1 Tax=Streptomyces fuscus TaxID=3048495 RepID=A0ABT7J0T0_9ACTN|nr:MULTISPECIES: lipoprotein [Streptomyces]MDL2078410.1 lipoprotein [Streptomyces fuscus]SBT93020.1 hypothetical protein GA0115233_105543 [Streptomyces sp. DI166]